MQRDINSFPIPPSFRLKLNNAGFSSAADVLELKPSELSKEINISREDALELIKTFKSGAINPVLHEKSEKDFEDEELLKGTSSGSESSGRKSNKLPVTGSISGVGDRMRTATAFQMLQKEQSLPPIITFCEELDEMLGGGVPMSKITEICGAPGVGKTQTCIQLCVDVQIPGCLGGVEGEAVYIDTEGSFIPQRAWDIAQAASEHCYTMAGTGDQTGMQGFNTEKILSGIHYFRCHNHVELIALVNLLPEFLSKNPKVKLIVVDSIAFHFRHDFDDMSLRTRLLNGLAQNLIRIATQYNLAVVLTNQMTTKIGEGTSHLVPALGESWGHACTIRLILYWKQAQRFANLYKSPSKQEATVPFQITQAGVRSVPRNQTDSEPQPAIKDGTSYRHQEELTNHHGNQDNNMDNPRKRLRSEDPVT
ncbi:DNA repair protein RAD51 homolog 3-like [Lytechinus variegatus]|uniref:DNA repair protein RAD51 homolog 3-like n=1 Tax=Lytechinus variegatus TaxID=7654 RepID=UPI001BB172C0|nr:DNA repair protein RAD51 homolog 3-like [Lytechinus variegatus]